MILDASQAFTIHEKPKKHLEFSVVIMKRKDRKAKTKSLFFEAIFCPLHVIVQS